MLFKTGIKYLMLACYSLNTRGQCSAKRNAWQVLTALDPGSICGAHRNGCGLVVDIFRIDKYVAWPVSSALLSSLQKEVKF